MTERTSTVLEAEPTAQQQATREAAEQYGASHIQVLKNAAHIRQNPGMYIGASNVAGMHHLLYEVVHNSVDEAMAGFCKEIVVTIHLDGSITVEDDGRGIPVEMHPTEKRSTLELVMCEVGAGGKFSKDTYKVSAGLHGMGIKAVNALSEWTEVEVRRDGKVYQQEYERGLPVSEVRVIGKSNRNGTKITFRPDPEFFHDAAWDYDTLEARLRELAFLNKGLKIHLIDQRTGKEDTFLYEGGVREFVEYLNRNEEVLHKPPVVIEDDRDNVHVEVVFQYNAGEEERLYAYVNNVHTRDGGTHVSGFRSALTRTLNQYGSKEGLFKEGGPTPQGEDFREGLTAIVSVRVPHPQFESQTKVRLNNPEVEGIVASTVNEHLARFLEENPQAARKIIQKVLLTAEAREAAAKAKKQLKERKNILSGGGLPGKLMDCTSRDPDECELFLVEGDSAGGSADSGRDRVYQAVLPLRGKILNVEKARLEKMLDNSEICSMISAIGTDIGENEDVSKRRYDKIIIMTDADVDGSHIRTLLLTFLYRQMKNLVKEGHVYLAQPPLYRIVQRKQVRYVQTNEAMQRELMDRGLKGARLVSLDGREPPLRLDGDRLRQLTDVLAALENALHILEQRGLTLEMLLANARNGQLPRYRIFHIGKEHWFYTPTEVTEFCQRQVGGEAGGMEGTAAEAPAKNGSGNGQVTQLDVQDLHEVPAIARGLQRLAEFGLGPDALIPPKAVAGLEPPPRFQIEIENEETKRPLQHLRELVPEIRKLGERGMNITRFKGLGEMDPEELWATTLDPARRTLVKVTLEDAFKADELFRILMGDKVEPRREFIEKHALEVRNLDI
ncbi:MAG: DNA gyrase subunit B [Gemmatales bacterium]|nr:DNA gyrase subunit B [Gemmatales bacterium]MDW8388395.1 DNA gyrase subunit B [Gemmatales bacterium]